MPCLLPLLLLGIASAAPAPVDSSGVDAVEALLAASDLRRLELRHGLIDPDSFRAEVAGEAWSRGSDFRLDAREGIWLPLRRLGPRDGGPVPVVLRYRHAGAPIPVRAELHPMRTTPPAPPDVREREREEGAAEATSLPGDLVVRGSKTVRMASGNRRELVVDQNLRLNISGHLTEDIRVHALLSDDNLPVVPEGNTEELRDIDRVRVDVQAPGWTAVLGDFTAVRRGSRFGGYRRKLQGAQVEAGREGPLAVEALAGAPRGRFRTVTLRGQEANQGPYALGAGSGSQLFVVAGSERVDLDGERLQRGADRDYVIDYVRGTVTFTYRRLITAGSEIVVEYEEGEGPYARSVAGVRAGATGRLPGLPIPARFRLGLIRERDDPDRPRSGELDEDDRAVLASAGDDVGAAVADGLVPVEPGEGAYRLDELGGVAVAVWDTLAGDHDVQFYLAGQGLGDYAVERLTEAGVTVYVYRGPGGGSWRIGRPLELPESQSVMSASLALGDTALPWFDGEWHRSRRDPNVLSERDDADDDAGAWRLQLDGGERRLRWGGRDLGAWGFRLEHEDLGAGFAPFVRVRDPFRYQRWGLAARAARTGFLAEADRSTDATLTWRTGGAARRADLELNLGRLRHGSALSAAALGASLAWSAAGLEASHALDRSKAEDGVDPLDVRRRRDEHAVALVAGPVRPSVSWRRDRVEDDVRSAAAAAAGSDQRRLRLALDSAPAAHWAWSVGWTDDQTDSLRVGGWERERDGRTWDWRLGSPQLAGMRLTADGSWRRVAVPGGEDRTTRLAKVRLAGRWDATGSDWAATYGVDNSRTEVLDRQVVYVGEREGDYNQAGDFVGHELGDFNVVTVGTDSLVATTEVVADLTWRQDFGFLGRKRFWGAWSTFTRLTARGRSRTDDVAGLLSLGRDRLLDPVDGVLGEIGLRQEAVLLKHRRDWDLRLALDFDEVLDRQYAAHPERRLQRRQEAVLTHNPRDAVSLRWRSRHENDGRRTEESAFSSNRSYDTDLWRHEFEVSLRPGPGDRLALAVDRVGRDDAVSRVVQAEWGVKPSARWRLAKRWNGQVELRWSRVTSEEPPGVLRPFFFAYPGDNVDMTTRLSWDPSGSMTVTLSHASRRLGSDRGWRHDVRVESTARF